MAGHNKWSKVKHVKARVDVIKARVFSKCSHEIALAARAGGGDPGINPRLRAAIDGAKAVSMPKENIERAIRKGTGELGGEAIQEVSYEGYGPGGIAFLIEMATDNLNRSAADVRSMFTKNDGSIATPGSVAYQFDRIGEIRFAANGTTTERLMEIAIEAGANDAIPCDSEEHAEQADPAHTLLTAPNELGTVANRLRESGIRVLAEKLVFIPQAQTVIGDIDVARRILKLHDLLDDYPDTVNVFTNFEVADDIINQLAD
ncbi:MAG: YebC/PmpR family DNA-binding transcriptional regulator [Luteolibacter sp.]|jgi:YebC/PmpR family DNA-binding regulatory protein